MEPVIEPVSREALMAELTPQTLLRTTNRASNELYVVGPEAVNVIREIGRLREIAFRNDGGGTGRELDIDEFDTDPAFGYKQLVLWDPEAQEIIGGYRFCICDQALFNREGQPVLTSSHMFHFSKKFIKHYLPYTLELGRSFVSVEYQSSKAGAKSLYALDNLFDGIGALGVLYKKRIKYFFGKATIYQEYPAQARELIMCFLRWYFGKGHRLLHIRKEVKVERSVRRRNYRLFKGLDFKEGYRVLKAEIQKMGVSIPPLVNTYMNLSPSMIYFGTGINDEFGDVFDSGILVTFLDMYPEKRLRHSDSFKKLGGQVLRKLLRRFSKN
ncbi:MAG: GNAT family N-acetyltransferase [Bacteroidales bacterium]|nr:GNAT family N-acetyltransferase [Bacteroidales bacterium]